MNLSFTLFLKELLLSMSSDVLPVPRGRRDRTQKCQGGSISTSDRRVDHLDPTRTLNKTGVSLFGSIRPSLEHTKMSERSL